MMDDNGEVIYWRPLPNQCSQDFIISQNPTSLSFAMFQMIINGVPEKQERMNGYDIRLHKDRLGMLRDVHWEEHSMTIYSMLHVSML